MYIYIFVYIHACLTIKKLFCQFSLFSSFSYFVNFTSLSKEDKKLKLSVNSSWLIEQLMIFRCSVLLHLFYPRQCLASPYVLASKKRQTELHLNAGQLSQGVCCLGLRCLRYWLRCLLNSPPRLLTSICAVYRLCPPCFFDFFS